MADEASRAELLSLTEEVREALSYMRELGVDYLESAGTIEFEETTQQFDGRSARATSAPMPDTPRFAALKRNAEAEARVPKTPPAEIPTAETRRAATTTTAAATTSTRPANATQNSHTEAAAEEMPKRKPVRTPDPVPPPPQETLFGEIKPKDELSLPRDGETFEDIRQDVGECLRCPLHKSRTQIVHSEGSAKARLMFVGEAPGADEDASGRPFVGRAGQLLNKIIEAIGMKREEIFIGNVNRCRPPQNRTPTHEEAATCKPFLLREIAILRPDVIVVLGNTAMKNLLDTKEGITKLRGTFMDYKGIKVMPTFHPAYLLRDPSKKRETWEDMKKVREYLNKTKADK
jgi:DNA polymerase